MFLLYRIIYNIRLDKGQKDQYYDYSRIVRNKGTTEPSKQLLVVFDYYSVPSNDGGDVFTVLSYDKERFTHDVPFIGPRSVRSSDTLDFRPRVSIFTSDSSSPFDFASRTLSPTRILSPNESSLLGYDYYLARIDKLYLDRNKNFILEKGISSNTPKAPDKNDAVMEITMTGPMLRFLLNTKISITGANISPSINDHPIDLNKVINVKKGDVLSFGKLIFGIRSYIGVSGGFLTKIVMNSRSMYSNITKAFRIKNKEIIQVSSMKSLTKNITFTDIDYIDHFKNNKIEVFEGPEFECLSKIEKENLFNKSFTISNYNNRMAYQLEDSLKNNLKPIITSLVMQGTVQLTPLGKIIILMRDNQTCGGYPRILQLNENSINKLSQKHVNNYIKFELIDALK